MYSIRIKQNQGKKVLTHDTKEAIGVLLKNGDLRFVRWGGFTLEMVHPGKLYVHQYTADGEWDPRRAGSKMPIYTDLKQGDYRPFKFSSLLWRTVLLAVRFFQSSYRLQRGVRGPSLFS